MEYITLEQDVETLQVRLTLAQITAVCQQGLGTNVSIRRVRELAGGTFNTTFLVEGMDATKTILRVAPPPSADQDWEDAWLMRREVAIQPFFSSIQHLMPKILAVDFTHQVIGRDYMLQTFIEGERWDRLEETLAPVENLQLWQQFGGIVKQIHITTGAHFGWPAPGPQFATWRETVLYRFERTLQAMTANQLNVMHFRRAYELTRANGWALAEIQTPHLLHGDLWPFNVLVKQDVAGPKIVGVLDADRAWWGDPLADWTMFLLAVRRDEPESQSMQSAFWGAYGEPERNQSICWREEIYKAMYFGNVALWHASHREMDVVERAQAELEAVTQKLTELSQP